MSLGRAHALLSAPRRERANTDTHQPADARLRFETALLEAQVEASPDGVIVIAADGEIISINRHMIELWGFPEAVIATRRISEARAWAIDQLEDPDDFARTADHFYQNPLADGHDEVRLRDGRTFERFTSPLIGSDGELFGRIWTYRDISERRAMETALREAESRYRALVEHIPAVTYLQANDAYASAIYMSPQIEALIGYTPAEWLADPELWVKLIHPDDHERVMLEHLRTNLTGEPFSMEYRLLARDGRVVWVRDEGVLIHDSGAATGVPQPLHWQGVFLDITRQKAAEEQLRASEERFRSLSAASPIGIYQTDTSGFCLYTNARWQEISGLSAEESLGFGWADVIYSADRDRILAEWASAVAAGSEHRSEFRVVTPEGILRWVAAHSAPIHTSDGAMAGYVGSITDITERKEVEDAQRGSEERFRAAVEGGQDAFYILKALRDAHGAIMDFTFIDANTRAGELLGSTREAMIGERICELFPVTKPGGWFDKYVRVAETREPLIEEFPDPTPGFEGCWLYHQVVPVSGDIAVTTRDITDRKRAEEAMRESEERFRGAFDGAAVGMTLTDIEGRYLRVNDALCTMLGYTRAELLGMRLHEVTHPDDLDTQLSNAIQVMAQERDAFQLEKRYIHKDGHIVHALVGVSPISAADGSVAYFVGQIQDISGRKQAEDALRESEERFRRSFNDASIGMALIDLEGRWQQVNAAMCRMLGYGEDELLGQLSFDVSHPDDQDTIRALGMQLLDGERDTFQVETRYVHKRGSTVWGFAGVSAIRNREGAPIYFIAQVQDISERKLLEERLRHQALHDPLTGLANRAHFTERLEAALYRARESGRQSALLFLDLDGFKSVNDTHGHDTGDQLLVAVGRRLQGSVRPGDTVARLGGDEFTILLENMPEAGQALAIARRIVEDLAQPFRVNGVLATVGVSAGIAYSAAHVSAAQLLQHADSALYSAKTAGKGQWAVYGDENGTA